MSWPDWDLMLNGDAEGTTNKAVRAWWETRRFRYNMLVGIVGVATWLLVVFAGSAAVKPGEDFEEPLAMILGPPFYAVMANLCYSFGPLIDSIKGNGRPSKGLFKMGLIFSLMLTALPGLWALYAWITTIVTGHKLE